MIDGVEVSSSSTMMPPHRRKLSMVFQDLALWPHMTVGQHLEFVVQEGWHNKARCPGGDRQDSPKCPHRKPPWPLSASAFGGEKQRLAIGRALASFPSYLLMDEPFSHLDPRLKEELQELLLSLNQETKMGIVYVTHNIRKRPSPLPGGLRSWTRGCWSASMTRENVSNRIANGTLKAR